MVPARGSTSAMAVLGRVAGQYCLAEAVNQQQRSVQGIASGGDVVAEQLAGTFDAVADRVAGNMQMSGGGERAGPERVRAGL